MNDKLHCCCFFGHRRVKETIELKKAVYAAVEGLIIKEGVDVFFVWQQEQL